MNDGITGAISVGSCFYFSESFITADFMVDTLEHLWSKIKEKYNPPTLVLNMELQIMRAEFPSPLRSSETLGIVCQKDNIRTITLEIVLKTIFKDFPCLITSRGNLVGFLDGN